MPGSSAPYTATVVATCVLCATALAHPLGERERLLGRFEQEPLVVLERMYLRCARVSAERLMAFDEAAACSTASEALLKRRFDGDFAALLAWWRLHRDDLSGGAADTQPTIANR